MISNKKKYDKLVCLLPNFFNEKKLIMNFFILKIIDKFKFRQLK